VLGSGSALLLVENRNRTGEASLANSLYDVCILSLQTPTDVDLRVPGPRNPLMVIYGIDGARLVRGHV